MKKLKLSKKTLRQLKKIQWIINRFINIYCIFSILELILALIINVNALSSFNAIVLIFKLLDCLLIGFIF